MQTLAGYLKELTLPIAIAFFYMFFKAMQSLSKEERKRYNKAGSKWRSILGILLIAGIFYSEDFWSRSF